jgi:dolichol kinase
MALTKEEITRKLLHLFALLMPAGIFYLPGLGVPDAVPIGILAFLFFGSVAVELIRFRVRAVQKAFYFMFGHMLRREETAKITGSTYVIGAALICSLIFINHKHISLMVLTLFILGDAIAAIVGLSVGRIKIGKKSLEGSAACFILCMILFYALFPYLPGKGAEAAVGCACFGEGLPADALWYQHGILGGWSWKVHILIALAASLSITVFELIPLRISKKLVINDNLAVPIITGGVIFLMETALLGQGG